MHLLYSPSWHVSLHDPEGHPGAHHDQEKGGVDLYQTLLEDHADKISLKLNPIHLQNEESGLPLKEEEDVGQSRFHGVGAVSVSCIVVAM